MRLVASEEAQVTGGAGAGQCWGRLVDCRITQVLHERLCPSALLCLPAQPDCLSPHLSKKPLQVLQLWMNQRELLVAAAQQRVGNSLWNPISDDAQAS